MNSATSTDSVALGARAAASRDAAAFRPWQFFLLAGMLAATATVIVATGQSPASIVVLSLTIVSASFVGLAAYRALAPLVSAEVVHAPVLLGGRTRAALEREKALVLRSIKELEFDYAMGKVAKTDFDEMSGRLRARALRLMRQLDAGQGYRHEIEKEVAARLGSPAARTADTKAARVVATGQCASCGTSNDADAKFCKNCGSRLDARG